MKIVTTAAVLAAIALGASASAYTVDLGADTAPNVYGSPDYAAWWAGAQADIVGGTFSNMSSGQYAGTNYFNPMESVVYSTGDLGQRLHWVYFVEGATVAGLEGLFEVKNTFDWDGVTYTYDWDNGGVLVEDAPELGWVQPGSWTNYDDGSTTGVIGTFGHAWWAYDDLAAPFNTDGSAYNETDGDDIYELALQISQYQTFASGFARVRDSLVDDWVETGIVLVPVPIPLPTPLGLATAGLIGVAAIRRRR